jgi:hypothetical protein
LWPIFVAEVGDQKTKRTQRFVKALLDIRSGGGSVEAVGLTSAVCAENLDSTIVVMKAAENGSGSDCADALNSPMEGRILVQSPMGPQAFVIGGILAKDPAQVSLSEHHQVVEALPSDRAD